MQEQGANGADKGTPPLFHEEQRFQIWMFWVPIAIVVGLVWYELYQQVFKGNPSGSHPIPDWAAWTLAIVFGIGLPVFGYLLRLITEVRPDALILRVFPFRGTRVPVGEIEEAETRDYSAQQEYSGWGVKNTRRSGRAYTAFGTKGVQLVLADGDRLLVGSQKAAELAAALREAGVLVR
jgi:hypothetical protein